MSVLKASPSKSSPSWRSMARLTLPSRLALNSPEGSSSAAPLANVSFTMRLYVSPVQMMPSCDHTGTPRHFHSSTTSGSACLMSARTRASIAPRQSPSSLIRASISRAGELPAFPSCAPPVVFAMMGGAFLVAGFVAGRSHPLARQFAGLCHPGRELRFVERVVLADVEIAHVLVPGLAGRQRAQRHAAEECHFDVLREAMKAEEPA